ncbi:hypothetical protein C8Q70DRAFT_1055572 [Cubamyces menziesii]|uniref:Uncharacterized protein n=1 Tax=Trametes cubensis TaxID=1111947 RepID=A0AAD7XBF1_9APHY|nr:hypothetical protein C8Q70DRAFT_1055572 [Cubamyces menziesii]KAJ8482822.1 hypothetical protein ONZ51_g5108 [Trametes cubensis]
MSPTQLSLVTDADMQNVAGANEHFACWNDPFFLLWAYFLFFIVTFPALCRLISPSRRIKALLQTTDALRYDLAALVEEGLHEKAVEGLRRQVDDLEKHVRSVQASYASPTPAGRFMTILRRLPDFELRSLAARAAQLQKDVKHARNGWLLV